MSELIRLGEPTARPKAPKADELTLRFSQRGVNDIEALIQHYPTLKACILPGLWVAQREYGGYLSPEAIAEVAFRLKRPYAEVEGVATFYSMYNSRHAVGKHKLELCTCLSCHVNKAFNLRDYIVKKLGIHHGETTADGLFTFEEVECLNACSRAPVMQVGDTYHGPIDEAYIDRLIDELRNTEESTVVKMADEIVKAQLRDVEQTPVA